MGWTRDLLSLNPQMSLNGQLSFLISKIRDHEQGDFIFFSKSWFFKNILCRYMWGERAQGFTKVSKVKSVPLVILLSRKDGHCVSEASAPAVLSPTVLGTLYAFSKDNSRSKVL